MTSNSISPSSEFYFQHAFKKYATINVVAVLIIALLVLAGWEFDIIFFRKPITNAIAMNPMTAVAFVFAALSFLLLQPDRFKKNFLFAGWVLAVVVIIIGLLRVIAVVTQYDAGVDQWLYSEKVNADIVDNAPNHMTPSSAMNIILTGIALLSFKARNRSGSLLTISLVFCALIALLSITGYTYGVKSFTGVFSHVPMAIHSAICFFLMATAILFSLKNNRFMAVMISPHGGGKVARVLVPMTIIVPLILGMLRLAGERIGLYNTPFGTTLMVTATIVIFVFLVWRSAVSINRAEISLTKEIEERKRVEEETKNTNLFLDAILQNIPTMIFVKEAKELRFIQINKEEERLLGISRAEILGKTDYDIFPREQADYFTETDKKIIAGLKMSDIPEEKVSTKEGDRWLHTKKIPFYDAQGNPLYIIGISEDITELKQQQDQIKQFYTELEQKVKDRTEELLKSNKELEQFAYVASHDLQEPLRMVSGFLQLLEKKYKNELDETATEYIHYAVDGAERMKKLIVDLLAYSRVGTSKALLTEVNLNEVVQHVTDTFEMALNETEGKIITDQLPVITADKTQMIQLFQNLIGNAIKYRGKDAPIIEISCRDALGEWILTVKDNGIGIEPRFFEKIFIIFQRLHSKVEYSGTGIGLAICKKIIERHGGHIRVESELGKGSCFIFTLKKDIAKSIKNKDITL